jgi:hypothetical protein
MSVLCILTFSGAQGTAEDCKVRGTACPVFSETRLTLRKA